MARCRGDDVNLWRLRLRARIRHRAQMARDPPLPDGTDLNQPDPRLYRPARPRHAALVLSVKIEDGSIRLNGIGSPMRFTRITVGPRQMGGVPCLRGLRIPVLLSSAWSRMEWPKPRTLPHTLTCSTRTSPRLCVTPRRPCANAGCRSLSREISCRQCLISNPRRAAATERIRCRPCTRLPPPTADNGQVFEREKRKPHRYLRGYRFRHAPCADPGARTFSDPVPTGPRQTARASGGSAASQSGGLGPALQRGCIAVLEASRIRVRLLPIR